MRQGLLQLLKAQDVDRELKVLEEAKSKYPAEISQRQGEIEKAENVLTELTDHVSELESEVADWFLGRTTRDAVDHLSSFSVPCAPVNSVAEAANEPHLSEREIMVEVPDPIAGSIHVTGKMIKFSRTPLVVGSAPLVGEHTDEVLRDILGYSDEQVQALQDDGVVRSAGPAVVPG